MTDTNKQALEALDWIEKHSDDPQLNKLKGLYCQLDTIRAALQPKPSVDTPCESIEALRNYGQADMDGIMCVVSRQAVDEVIDFLDSQGYLNTQPPKSENE